MARQLVVKLHGLHGDRAKQLAELEEKTETLAMRHDTLSLNARARVIRTVKEQCAHRHRFDSLQHASRLIGDWIDFYNYQRPHQALNMRTPAEAFTLAA